MIDPEDPKLPGESMPRLTGRSARLARYSSAAWAQYDLVRRKAVRSHVVTFVSILLIFAAKPSLDFDKKPLEDIGSALLVLICLVFYIQFIRAAFVAMKALRASRKDYERRMRSSGS